MTDREAHGTIMEESKANPLDDPFYDRLRIFLEATNAETARGRALVTASVIEEMLESVLRSFLLEDSATKKLFDDPNAPLSTFSAKASASRALGLITSEEFSDIDLVRKIRNAFAHNILCSFADPKVGTWARQLRTGMSAVDALHNGDSSRVDNPEQRFSMVAASLVTALYNRAHYAEKSRLQDRSWPS
ncbi:MAG: hypothetical protein V7668_05050 [Cereibacter changlensis]